MEFDRGKLPASIGVAEKAIHQRLRGLPIANSKEHRELRDALKSLAVLKKMLWHIWCVEAFFVWPEIELLRGSILHIVPTQLRNAPPITVEKSPFHSQRVTE